VDKVEYIIEHSNKGNIVVRIFKEKMSKKDIEESFNHMIDTGMLDDNSIGLITDISHSLLELDMADLEKMTSFISTNKLLSRLKIAVVGDSPDKIIFPTLANFKLGDSLMPFSSIEAAKDWILANDCK